MRGEGPPGINSLSTRIVEWPVAVRVTVLLLFDAEKCLLGMNEGSGSGTGTGVGTWVGSSI